MASSIPISVTVRAIVHGEAVTLDVRPSPHHPGMLDVARHGEMEPIATVTLAAIRDVAEAAGDG